MTFCSMNMNIASSHLHCKAKGLLDLNPFALLEMRAHISVYMSGLEKKVSAIVPYLKSSNWLTVYRQVRVYSICISVYFDTF